MFMLNMENQKTKCEKLRVKLLMIILNKNCMKMTFGPMDQKSFLLWGNFWSSGPEVDIWIRSTK